MKYDNSAYKDKASILPKIESPYLLRSVKPGKSTPGSLSRQIRRVFKEKGIELIYSTVKLSGDFYRLHRKEREGFSVEFDDMIADETRKKGIDIS